MFLEDDLTHVISFSSSLFRYSYAPLRTSSLANLDHLENLETARHTEVSGLARRTLVMITNFVIVRRGRSEAGNPRFSGLRRRSRYQRTTTHSVSERTGVLPIGVVIHE